MPFLLASAMLLSSTVQRQRLSERVPLRALYLVASIEPARMLDGLAVRRSATCGEAGLEFGREILSACPSLRPAADRFTDRDRARVRRQAARLRRLTRYLPEAEQPRLRMALELSTLAHLGQLRDAGDLFCNHLIHLTGCMALRHMDASAITAGLLHDLCERSVLSNAQVRHIFGPAAYEAVSGGPSRAFIAELHDVIPH